MRLIGLLIALTIVALLVARQMHGSGDTKEPAPLATQPTGVPDTPQHADQVPQFKKQMNDFVDQKNAEQKKEIEQMSQ